MNPDILNTYLEKTRDHLINNWKASPDLAMAFLTSDDEAIVEEGFYFLAGELNLSDIDASEIPRGYFLLTLLFCWEQSCSGEGWQAFESLEEHDVSSVIEAYKCVGLLDEAEGVTKAYQAWKSDPDDENTIGEAYAKIPNKYSEDFDRIPYLVNYLKNHEELFH